MAASRFDCHISVGIDAKKSRMTKSLYRFYVVNSKDKIRADITCLGYIFPSPSARENKTQTGHISPYNLHKTYITNNIYVYLKNQRIPYSDQGRLCYLLVEHLLRVRYIARSLVLSGKKLVPVSSLVNVRRAG